MAMISSTADSRRRGSALHNAAFNSARLSVPDLDVSALSNTWRSPCIEGGRNHKYRGKTPCKTGGWRGSGSGRTYHCSALPGSAVLDEQGRVVLSIVYDKPQHDRCRLSVSLEGIVDSER